MAFAVYEIKWPKPSHLALFLVLPSARRFRYKTSWGTKCIAHLWNKWKNMLLEWQTAHICLFRVKIET